MLKHCVICSKVNNDDEPICERCWKTIARRRLYVASKPTSPSLVMNQDDHLFNKVIAAKGSCNQLGNSEIVKRIMKK